MRRNMELAKDLLSSYKENREKLTKNNKTKATKPTTTPSAPSKRVTDYEKYRAKFDKGDFTSLNNKDLCFYFQDVAKENGVKYITSNFKVEMHNFKLCKERGYTTEEILIMIEFLFTSGQLYLDVNRLHPGILLTGWANKIYQDSQLWLNDEYVVEQPKKKYSSEIKTREWKPTTDTKTKVGEW